MTSDLPLILLCVYCFLLGIKVHKDWVNSNHKWNKKHGKER